MTGPPRERPEDQDARGGSSGANANWVRIVNPALNGSPLIRRRDGNRLVQLQRAEWVGADQLRLVTSHPINRMNAAAAAAQYARAAETLVKSVAESRHVPIVFPIKALTARGRQRRRPSN
jgi:hypothetical protein